MNAFKLKKKQGFVALISASILSAVLLLIATSLSSASFYGRSNILDAELKEKSTALADACVEVAILNLMKNPVYVGEVYVGNDKCVIESVSPGNVKTIMVRADYGDYITKLEVKVDRDMSIISYEEM